MAKRGRRKQSNLDPVLSRGILAIVVVIVAIIFGLSFFEKAGTVGIILDEYVLSFLFGSIRYTVPFVMLVMAWYLIRDLDYNYHPTHGVGAFLFFLGLSGLMHIGFATSDMWSEVFLRGAGGGIFGMLAWPLKTYLGAIAGRVILVGIVAVGFFLIFNTSFTHFVMLNKKLFAGLGWVGKSILNLFGLFVEKNNKDLSVNGDYEEDEDEEEYETVEEEEENEEEEILEDVKDKRVFAKKTVKVDEDDEEKKEDDEEKIAAWQRNVVIKKLPSLELLSSKRSKPTSGDIKLGAEIIHDTFHEFNIGVEMGEVRVGPTVTQYSLKPYKGVKLTRITALSNDLALALAAHPIRIEAPIPGKSLVGIEVPNFKAAVVTLKELLESKQFLDRPHNLMIALGKDVAGKVWFADLPRMPHLLVAGATGSGKTVCINSIIMSLLYQNTAEELRLIMVDPKRVELTPYNGIPHLLTPVITNTQKTVNALKWCIGEMDRRFDVFSKSHSRDIGSYNSKHPNDKMPHIVFIIDELADLMATAASEVEAGIIRIAQMARAVGIHLIVATQRPSVDVITGLMKANIPARIAFSVASIIDSRTILDCPGADKLIGRGDMLFLTAELSKPVRIQGAFVSEQEVHNVAGYLKDSEVKYDESIVEKPGAGTINMFGGNSDDQDPLFMEAKEAIVAAGKASASFLQRRLKVGYARAARILDELEAAGIIGPSDGAKPREILTTEVEIDDSSEGMGQEFNAFDSDEEEGVETEEVEENSEEEIEESDEESVVEEDEVIEEELDDEDVEEEIEVDGDLDEDINENEEDGDDEEEGVERKEY